VGVSDNFSLGGGFGIPVIFFITPKFGFRVGDFTYLGGGILAASTLSTEMNFGFGIAYGSMTLGTEENSFTINAGWGAVKQEDYDDATQTYDSKWEGAKKPMFSISGMIRIAPKMALITENWIFATKEYRYDLYYYNDDEYNYKYRSVLTFGFRFMGERNSFDFAAAAISIDGETIGLPYFDYVFKF